MSSDLLTSLNVALMTERQTGDLQKLDPATITRALDQLAELEKQIRLAPHDPGAHRDLRNEHDAISDHLGTLIAFRSKKMLGAVGYYRPPNMLPVEADYFDRVSAATAAMRDAWGLTE